LTSAAWIISGCHADPVGFWRDAIDRHGLKSRFLEITNLLGEFGHRAMFLRRQSLNPYRAKANLRAAEHVVLL
jgi:hypothetical protein